MVFDVTFHPAEKGFVGIAGWFLALLPAVPFPFKNPDIPAGGKFPHMLQRCRLEQRRPTVPLPIRSTVKQVGGVAVAGFVAVLDDAPRCAGFGVLRPNRRSCALSL